MPKAKNKTKDVTAKIELEKELEKVQFRNASDCYKDVLSVTSRFDVTWSDTNLIKIMAKKVTSSTYASKIIDHLKSTSADNFEELCSDITTVQYLMKISSGGGN